MLPASLELAGEELILPPGRAGTVLAWGRVCVRTDLMTSESLCKVSNPWLSVVKEQHSVVWFLSWAGGGSLTAVELWVSRKGSEEPSCLRLW